MTANNTFDIPLTPDAGAQIKSAHRRMWALGDYHGFATSTVWQLGPVLVDACGISAGQRVLDVAAGREFVMRSNRSTIAERVEIPYDYLLVIARRRL